MINFTSLNAKSGNGFSTNPVAFSWFLGAFYQLLSRAQSLPDVHLMCWKKTFFWLNCVTWINLHLEKIWLAKRGKMCGKRVGWSTKPRWKRQSSLYMAHLYRSILLLGCAAFARKSSFQQGNLSRIFPFFIEIFWIFKFQEIRWKVHVSRYISSVAEENRTSGGCLKECQDDNHSV